MHNPTQAFYSEPSIVAVTCAQNKANQPIPFLETNKQAKQIVIQPYVMQKESEPPKKNKINPISVSVSIPISQFKS